VPACLPQAGSRVRSQARFAHAWRPTNHQSLLTNHAFLIASRQNIKNPANPLTINENTFSNR